MDECLTLDTEVLTKNGWTTIDKLEINDEILEWDMETQITSFKPINKITDVERDETFIFEGNNFNQHVSGGHRMIIEKNSIITESTGKELELDDDFNFINAGIKLGETSLSDEIKLKISQSKENGSSMDWVYEIISSLSSAQAEEFLNYYNNQ